METPSYTWLSEEVSLHALREKIPQCHIICLPPLSLSLTLPPGLPQLPLLYALVSTFKADISLQNSEGLTALCLAAKLGKEKLAEVCLNITRAMTVVVRYRMNLY